MESSPRCLYAEGVTVYQAIGRRISKLRRDRGWTQEHLAERANTSAPYVARIEAGTKRPTVDMLDAIAKALDVPLWRLFTSGRLTAVERESMEAGRDLAAAVGKLDTAGVRALVEVARRMVR